MDCSIFTVAFTNTECKKLIVLTPLGVRLSVFNAFRQGEQDLLLLRDAFPKHCGAKFVVNSVLQWCKGISTFRDHSL